MAAKVTIALSNVTAHVHDPDRSVPFEYDERGAIIQGSLVARPVPPWTPFEVDGDEADALLARHNGVKIPDGVVDARKWLHSHADELGIPMTQRGPLPVSERRKPIVELVETVSASVTPAFKAAARRGAAKQGITLAEYVRGAVSDRLLADGVRHRRPAGAGTMEHRR